MADLYNRRGVLRMGGLLAGTGLLAGVLPATMTTFAAEGETVNILNTSGELGVIMSTMLKNQGFDKDFGLEASFQNVSAGSQIIAGLVGGSADLCTSSGFSQLFPAIENGAPLKIIGGCLSLPTLSLFSAKPEVVGLADLPGRTIAVGALGSLLHMMAVAVLKKNGIDESTVQFVNVGSSGDAFRALVSGTVDVGFATADVMDQVDEYGIHALTNGQMWEELPNFTMQAAYATESTVENKRDLLVRTLAAHAKLYRFLSTPESWDAWQVAYADYFGSNIDEVRSRSLWTWIQERQPLATDLVLSAEQFDYVQQLNLDVGAQKGLVPYETAADMSLAQEAIALL